MKGTRKGRSPQSLILGSRRPFGGIKPGGAGQWLQPPLRVPTVQEATLDLSQLRSLPGCHQWTGCTRSANCGGKGSGMLVWAPACGDSLAFWPIKESGVLAYSLLESFQKLYEFQNRTFPGGKLEIESFLGCSSAAEIKR